MWVRLGGGSPQLTEWGILGENGDMNLPMLRVGLLCPTVSQWESFLQRYETSHY